MGEGERSSVIVQRVYTVDRRYMLESIHNSFTQKTEDKQSFFFKKNPEGIQHIPPYTIHHIHGLLGGGGTLRPPRKGLSATKSFT